MKQLAGLWKKPVFWYALFGILATVISVQLLLLGTKTTGDVVHTHFNNYVIFKNSFWHLIQGRDLYQHFPSEQYDLYKYSPAFALIFGVFAILPNWLGLILWNTLNTLSIAGGIFFLRGITAEKKGIALSIITLEMLTSLHNSQCNGLIAGLLLFGFGLLQRNKIGLACLLVTLTVFIKLFGLAGFSLFLFFPGKIRMFFWTALWVILFSFVPLLVVNWDQLMLLYESWFRLIGNDHSLNYGFSLLGGLHHWFDLEPNKMFVLGFGLLIYGLCLLRIDAYSDETYRLRMLAHVLMWVILFNHMSESPTIVIAITGVALWFVSAPSSRMRVALIVVAIVFTSLSSTDLFPRSWRDAWVYPKVIKVAPLLLVWMWLLYDLIPDKWKPAVQSI